MAEETKNTEVTTEVKEEKATTPNSEGAGAETTPKAKTEEEIRAEIQKEYEKMADKRVTDAIKKKEKEWADKAAKEKMSAEERAQAEERERLAAQAKKDLDLTIKGLKLDVVDAIAELGLDSGFRNLIAVEDLASISDAEVAKAVEKAKAEFLKGSTPATGDKGGEDKTAYDEAKKAGNVKGMISAKMAKYHNSEDE